MKKMLKGSFTIEAAVIVPVSMVIITAVIFLGFFMHDKVTMAAASAYFILENADKAGEGDERMVSQTEEYVNSNLIGVRNVGVEMSGGEGTYAITTEGSFDWKIPMIKSFMKGGLGTASVKINISSLNGREILLKYKLAKDMAGALLPGDD